MIIFLKFLTLVPLLAFLWVKTKIDVEKHPTYSDMRAFISVIIWKMFLVVFVVLSVIIWAVDGLIVPLIVVALLEPVGQIIVKLFMKFVKIFERLLKKK